MKLNFRAAAVVTAASLLSPAAFGITAERVQLLSSAVNKAKVVELPATASRLVQKAATADRIEVASVVVSITGKSHPSVLSSVIVSVLKVEPKAAEAVVDAAIASVPEHADSIIGAASSVVPQKAATLASKSPRSSLKANFQKEVSAQNSPTRQRQAVVAAADTVIGGDTEQKPSPLSGRPAPINLYAFPGFDPNRP